MDADNFGLDCDIDLSFLDVDEFANSLFKFRAILLRNEDVDMRVIELIDNEDVQQTIKKEFNKPCEVTQVILPNGSLDDQCPYFRIILQDYSMGTPVNYKLETFMRSAGILGIHARCTVAMVIGLSGNGMTAPMIDVPSSYRLCHIQPIEMLSPIDMTWATSGSNTRQQGSSTDIPGIVLPYLLPKELEWHILQYLRSPSAEIIQEQITYWNDFTSYWDARIEILLTSFTAWASSV